MKHLSYILFASLICVACSNNVNKQQLPSNSDSFSTIRLFPDKDKKILVNDIFEKISLISLETTERSLLGNIAKIDIDEERFFIQNSYRNDKFVYSFDFQGKFLNQIGYRGQGPGEMLFPECFALNKKEKEVWLVDNFKEIYKYNYEGRYIEKTAINLFFNNFYILDTGYIYYSISKKKNYKREENNRLICNELCIEKPESKGLTFHFPYNCETYPSGTPYYTSKTPFSDVGNAVTFHYIYSDNIYAISKDTVACKYLVDFGDKKLREDLSVLPTLKIEEILMREKDRAGLVDDVIETENVLMFTYITNLKKHFVFYNKKSQKHFEGLLPDVFYNVTFMTSVNNELIGYFNPYKVDKNKAVEAWNLSQNDKNIINDMNADDNPILIKCSLKDF